VILDVGEVHQIRRRFFNSHCLIPQDTTREKNLKERSFKYFHAYT
jgi:hypothetical protein